MDELTGWWLDEYDGPRFRRFVDTNGPDDHATDPLSSAEGRCWQWTGSLDKQGYGQFRMGRQMMRAHRIAWLDGGRSNRIPGGYVIDHLCRNHSCVNPRHLQPIEPDENVRRGLVPLHNREYCRNGHELSESGIVSRKHSTSGTVNACAVCARESSRRRHAREKAQAE